LRQRSAEVATDWRPRDEQVRTTGEVVAPFGCYDVVARLIGGGNLTKVRRRRVVRLPRAGPFATARRGRQWATIVGR
jgi:hypothetical protein